MDKSSMLYWWPKVKDISVPKPETIIIRIGYRPLLGMLDGEPLRPDLHAKIMAATRQLDYPLFVRTDQASGKHDWERTCYVDYSGTLWKNIYRLIEFNEIAGVFGLQPEALVFRKYIPLEAPFKAFYGQMPVARERRYFVRDGGVECHHPYWIEDAISEWWERVAELGAAGVLKAWDQDKLEPLPTNWREVLAELNNETQEEIKLLTAYAEEIGRAIGKGYWSVDFAKGQDGVWYFIDMAEGEKSWHPEHEK
ncbi:MAG: ATP-grasp domain-containing protein [Moorellaceae bacterium]